MCTGPVEAARKDSFKQKVVVGPDPEALSPLVYPIDFGLGLGTDRDELIRAYQENPGFLTPPAPVAFPEPVPDGLIPLVPDYPGDIQPVGSAMPLDPDEDWAPIPYPGEPDPNDPNDAPWPGDPQTGPGP